MTTYCCNDSHEAVYSFLRVSVEGKETLQQHGPIQHKWVRDRCRVGEVWISYRYTLYACVTTSIISLSLVNKV